MPTVKVVEGKNTKGKKARVISSHASKIQTHWERWKNETGITQENAAPLIGLSQSTFSQLIRGERALTPESVVRFAYLFAVPPWELVENPTDLPPWFRKSPITTLIYSGLSKQALAIASQFDKSPTDLQNEIKELLDGR
jgi:transcriptional regulator with XRE-family HTH domain